MATPGLPDTEGDSVEIEEHSNPLAMLFGVLFLLGILFLAVLVLFRIYPGSRPEQADPGFLDIIFANNLVVFATRLVLFSAGIVLAFVAAYIIWSIVNWMKQGQWLTRAGPFEVSQEAISQLQDEVQFWVTSATEANAEVQALRQRVEDSDELIDQLHELVREQEGEIERLRATGGT